MTQHNKKIPTWMKNILTLFLILGTGVLMIAAGKKQKTIVCNDMTIDIKNDMLYKFIDKPAAKKIVNDMNVIHTPLQKIAFSNLEKRLEENPFIEAAEVFAAPNGTLKVEIEQKKPQYRIINTKHVSYYISDSGTKIPLSDKFTPKVIVALGHIPNVDNVLDDSTNMQLYNLVQLLEHDAFLNAMFGQIYITENVEFEFIPRIQGHTVLFGHFENVEDKIKRLKLFYKKAMLQTNWNQYKTISLKFNGQIVCTKK